MEFQLDLNRTFVSLDGTSYDNGPTLIWSADTLGDGDHQLLVYVGSLQQNGIVMVDYFEYVLLLLHFVTRIVLHQDFCFQG